MCWYVVAGMSAGDVQLSMQTAMLQCIGKRVKEVIKVDMTARLKQLGLFDLFPGEVCAEHCRHQPDIFIHGSMLVCAGLARINSGERFGGAAAGQGQIG